MENNQGEHHNHKGSDMQVCNSWMCGGMQSCGCDHGFNGHGHLLKRLFKLIVVIFVVCMAFKLGELKGMLESRMDFGGYRHGSMMMYGNDYYDGYGQQMMYGTDYGAPDTTPATPTPTTVAPKTSAK